MAVVRVICAVEEAICESKTASHCLLEPGLLANPSCHGPLRKPKAWEDYKPEPFTPSTSHGSPKLVAMNDTTQEKAMIAQTKIPLIDIAAPKIKIQDRVNQRTANVLESEQFIMGPEVQELEE